MRTARRVRSRASTLNPVCGFVAVFLFAPVTQANTWNEVGEAGEALDTANVTTGVGALTTINGTLIDLGGGVDDIDLYKIFVVDPDAFAVSTSANLSVNNNAVLFVTNQAGLDRADKDSSSSGLLPEFPAGTLAGETPGIFYLGFYLNETEPVIGFGIPLQGWERDPDPFQTGPYTLSLTGVEFSVVPLPAAAWLFGSALGLLGWIRRRTS